MTKCRSKNTSASGLLISTSVEWSCGYLQCRSAFFDSKASFLWHLYFVHNQTNSKYLLNQLESSQRSLKLPNSVDHSKVEGSLFLSGISPDLAMILAHQKESNRDLLKELTHCSRTLKLPRSVTEFVNTKPLKGMQPSLNFLNVSAIFDAPEPIPETPKPVSETPKVAEVQEVPFVSTPLAKTQPAVATAIEASQAELTVDSVSSGKVSRRKRISKIETPNESTQKKKGPLKIATSNKKTAKKRPKAAARR